MTWRVSWQLCWTRMTRRDRVHLRYLRSHLCNSTCVCLCRVRARSLSTRLCLPRRISGPSKSCRTTCFSRLRTRIVSLRWKGWDSKRRWRRGRSSRWWRKRHPMHGRIRHKQNNTCKTNSSLQWCHSKALSNKISTGHKPSLMRVLISRGTQTLMLTIAGLCSNTHRDHSSKKMLIMRPNHKPLNTGSPSCKSPRKIIYKNHSLFP